MKLTLPAIGRSWNQLYGSKFKITKYNSTHFSGYNLLSFASVYYRMINNQMRIFK